MKFIKWCVTDGHLPWKLSVAEVHKYATNRLAGDDVQPETLTKQLSAIRKFAGVFGWTFPNNDPALRFMCGEKRRRLNEESAEVLRDAFPAKTLSAMVATIE